MDRLYSYKDLVVRFDWDKLEILYVMKKLPPGSYYNIGHASAIRIRNVMENCGISTISSPYLIGESFVESVDMLYPVVMDLLTNFYGRGLVLASDGVERDAVYPMERFVRRGIDLGYAWEELKRVPNWNMSGRAIALWSLTLPEPNMDRDTFVDSFEEIKNGQPSRV